jgi:hypothetical protein
MQRTYRFCLSVPSSKCQAVEEECLEGGGGGKPAKELRAETCAERKSTSPACLAIPAFDRIAGHNNGHLIL